MIRRFGTSCFVVAAAACAALAAAPPTTLSYQGVLRDSQDKPVSGTFDMVFGFFDAATAGNQILVDTHAAAGSGGVSVDNGLFDALLGGGTVRDGSGPGIYQDLGATFRDFGAVWLEISVNGETLAPRLKLQSSAYALSSMSATQLDGRPASSFLDTSGVRQIKNGTLRVESSDPTYAVLDVVADQGSPYALWAQNGAYVCQVEDGYNGLYCAGPSYGMEGYGYTAGAFFQQTGSSNYAYLAYNGYGLLGNANYTGANVYGGSYGVYATSNGTGVYASGSSNGVYANGGPYGVQAYGNNDGVYGQGYYGVYGSGNWAGTYGSAYIGAYGYGTYGVEGISSPGGFGGYFSDGDAYSYVGDHNSNGVYYKIWGNGTVSFVQNHPEASDKTINYAAPEGDEAAVYTRGKARLTHGEAHVALGDTFKWVANPDVGLTASVTARGPSSGLYVAAVSPTELVVRDSAGTSDVEFDYMVWGLRIGFEQMTTVQPKHDYSPVPPDDSTAEFYAKNPELRRFNALERFKAMEPEGKTLDLTRGRALLAAVNRFDPNVDGPIEESKKPKPVPSQTVVSEPVPRHVAQESAVSSPPPSTAPSASPRVDAAIGGGVPLQLLPVAEPVEAGDVVAMDPADGGLARPSHAPSDKMVVGIAIGASAESAAPVAWAGVVSCRVDATYGPIAAGDFLVASATAGRAMRAPAAPVPGTIVAKALEPWSAGTGTIRVLVVTH